VKERAERWLYRVRAEYAHLPPADYEQALAVEFDWYQAVCAHEDGNDAELSRLMGSRTPIPPVAREHLLYRLIHGRPSRPARRPRKITPDAAVHMVLFCKIFHGTGFCSKNGSEENVSFREVADLYGLTPDYIRKLFYKVPQDERDRREKGLREQQQIPE